MNTGVMGRKEGYRMYQDQRGTMEMVTVPPPTQAMKVAALHGSASLEEEGRKGGVCEMCRTGGRVRTMRERRMIKGEVEKISLQKNGWLELHDPKHRYSKYLRYYYDEWARMGRPFGCIVRWLENCDVEIEDKCTREQLDNAMVHYCKSEEDRKQYRIEFHRTNDGEIILRRLSTLKALDTGKEGWIFVLKNEQLYAAPKQIAETPRFHHSSFFAGGLVDAAGLIVVNEGKLEILYPHSGHYRPSDTHLRFLLKFLQNEGVCLRGLTVDAQRTYKVARSFNSHEQRVRKLDSPFLVEGEALFHLLSHKDVVSRICLFAELLDVTRERLN